MHYVRQVFFFCLAAAGLILPAELDAQVTTATLYGVHDASGAVLPGASVSAANQGTNLSREIVADERGEFALPALPAGAYTLKESVGLQLRADFFNAFKHVNYSSPDLNITSPTFGKITSATGARQGQVGVKVTF